jgi:hypothetical protein
VAGLAVPLALGFAVSMQVAGRERSWWRLSLAVIASQTLFHTLFTLGGSPVDMSQAGHHGAVSVGASHLTHSGAGMSMTHVIAAVLTIGALWHLESAERALRELTARVLARWVLRWDIPRVMTPAPARTVLPRFSSPPRSPRLVSTPMGRRGPPQAAY